MFPAQSRWVHLTPATTSSKLTPGDGLYAAATSAINRRDYGAALDMLQAARARKADDIRVLNAFGVVYDKLGRFDLSARYYAQAKAIDQNSPVVSNNLAYSQLMQHQLSAHADGPEADGPEQAAALQSTPPTIQLASRQPGVLYLDANLPKALVLTLPTLTGHPLVIVNASGRADGAETVRTSLAKLGWSTSKSASTVALSEARTTIRYSQNDSVAARALARTLPPNTEMKLCERSCVGVRLIVGVDAAKWKFAGHFETPRRS
jgi:tetratricopeptide (TPR) repeat protein